MAKSKTIKHQLGYLSRAGRFHACDMWGHINLAYDIAGEEGEEALENRGWLVLKGDPGINKFNWFYLGDKPDLLLGRSTFPSKAQWDFVFDWCQKKKIKFPPMHLDMLWEDQND